MFEVVPANKGDDGYAGDKVDVLYAWTAHQFLLVFDLIEQL